MKIQIIYLLLSFVLTAILGKIIIPILKKLKVGQNEREDGPRSHLRKQGTPTMGGIMMIISIIVFTAIACILNPEKELTKKDSDMLELFLELLDATNSINEFQKIFEEE